MTEAPADRQGPPRVRVVVMGVAGCGKSTVGRLLAARLGLPFVEGDELHPAANRERMRRGIPLTDADRAPWLAAVGAALAAGPGVVSCSALRRGYRDVLRQAAPDAWFVHLALDRAAAAARVGARTGHFMPESLVDSQFAALEPLRSDEPGVTVDATPAPDAVTATVLRRLRER